MNALAPPEPDPVSQPGMNGEPPVVLWSGQDPVVFSVVISTLAAANIPYREYQGRDYTASLSMPLSNGFYGMPHWEVLVFGRDLEQARSIVGAALRPLSVVHTESDNTESRKNSNTSLNEPFERRRKTAAQVEIWSGSNLSLLPLFRSALLENFIPCWEINASNGDIRLLVSADDLPRAREIIQKAQAA